MKAIFTANITREVKLMTSESGNIYARIPVAIDSQDDFGNKKPTFVDLSVFGERAERAAKDLAIGDLVKVEVRVTNRGKELGYGYNFLCTSIEVLKKKAEKKSA